MTPRQIAKARAIFAGMMSEPRLRAPAGGLRPPANDQKPNRAEGRRAVLMAKKRGKAKDRVTLPQPSWDTGTGTKAQRAGLVIEDATWWDEERQKEVNPNGVKRARRIDVVEMYHRKGVLDADQLAAALVLRRAYEATAKSPPAIKKVQVDTFGKPDQHVAILMDRISRFSAIMGLVPKDHREIIDCVVLENRTPAWLKRYRGGNFPRGIERMQEALSELAKRLEE